jgi:hypothetical protein
MWNRETILLATMVLLLASIAKASPQPNVQMQLDGDINNLSGDVSICVSGYGATTERIYVFIDGQVITELTDPAEGGCTVIDSRTFINGRHAIKVAAIDANGLVTLSANYTVNFANTIHGITSSDRFKRGEDYHVYGFNSSAENLRIKLLDWGGNIIWTSESSSSVNFAIPSDVLTGQIYDVVIEKSGSTMLKSGIAMEKSDESWESIWARSIGKAYDPNSLYKFAIFLPDTKGFLHLIHSDCRKRTVAEIVKACETKHMQYVVLYRSQCNWKNFNSVLSSPGISYAYMVAHGGSHVGPVTDLVQRTFFYLTDSLVLSEYDEDLPETIKRRKDVHYMSSLGMGSTNQMRIVQIDACSQVAYDDMAAQWIIPEEGNVDQLFISWNSLIGMNDVDYDIWGREIWFRLGNGDNYWKAQDYAAKDPNNSKPSFILGKVGIKGFDQITFTSQGS